LTYDHQRRLRQIAYNYEKGQRYYPEATLPFNRITDHLIATKQPLVFDQFPSDAFERWGMKRVPGTQAFESAVFVPLVAGSQVIGMISLQNVDRQNAFSETDARLLTTLANGMSVALQNARLFAETKRLLNETEQRAAELAVINSVQQALVAQLDFLAIIELVGNKLRDLFSAETLTIRLYDAA